MTTSSFPVVPPGHFPHVWSSETTFYVSEAQAPRDPSRVCFSWGSTLLVHQAGQAFTQQRACMHPRANPRTAISHIGTLKRHKRDAIKACKWELIVLYWDLFACRLPFVQWVEMWRWSARMGVKSGSCVLFWVELAVFLLACKKSRAPSSSICQPPGDSWPAMNAWVILTLWSPSHEAPWSFKWTESLF